MKSEPINKLGLIAGNGRFPFLLLDAARAHGVEVVVAAIKEETEAEMDTRAAADPGVKAKLDAAGLDPIEQMQPAEFARFIAADVVKWTPIIKASGASAD